MEREGATGREERKEAAEDTEERRAGQTDPEEREETLVNEKGEGGGEGEGWVAVIEGTREGEGRALGPPTDDVVDEETGIEYVNRRHHPHHQNNTHIIPTRTTPPSPWSLL